MKSQINHYKVNRGLINKLIYMIVILISITPIPVFAARGDCTVKSDLINKAMVLSLFDGVGKNNENALLNVFRFKLSTDIKKGKSDSSWFLHAIGLSKMTCYIKNITGEYILIGDSGDLKKLLDNLEKYSFRNEITNKKLAKNFFYVLKRENNHLKQSHKEEVLTFKKRYLLSDWQYIETRY